MYDFLIVGSGLTGAMYASVLKKHGKCLVVDKNDYIGGLCRTQDVHGITQHVYGAHIFRTNSDEVWNFVNSVCDFSPFVNTPIAVKGKKVYNLPFNMNTFAQLYGVVTPFEAKRVIEKDCVPCSCPSNLEEYILSKVGRKVYEELIEGYTYKQWGVECKKLPISTMSHIPIRLTYNNNYYDEAYQGIPVIGYTEFIARLMEGCEIVQDTFDLKTFANAAKHIVYTGPLDELFDYKYGKLDFRSVRFDTKFIPHINDMQGVAVMNYTSKEVPYTRSIEHKHFLHQKAEGTLISYEYSEYAKPDGKRIYPIRNERNLSLLNKYKELANGLIDFTYSGQQADYVSYNMNHIITNVLEWKKKYKL